MGRHLARKAQHRGLLCRFGRLYRPQPYNCRYAQLLRNCPPPPHNSAVIRNRPQWGRRCARQRGRRLRAGRGEPACGRADDAAGASASRRAELLAGLSQAAPVCAGVSAPPLLAGPGHCAGRSLRRSAAPAAVGAPWPRHRPAPAWLAPLVGRVVWGLRHLRPQPGHVAGPVRPIATQGGPLRGPRPRPSRPASGRSGPRRLRRRGPDHPASAGCWIKQYPPGDRAGGYAEHINDAAPRATRGGSPAMAYCAMRRLRLLRSAASAISL